MFNKLKGTITMKKYIVGLTTTLTLALLISCNSNSDQPTTVPEISDDAITTPDTTGGTNADESTDDTGENSENPQEDTPSSTEPEVEEDLYQGNEISTAYAEAIVASREEEANLHLPVMVSEEDPMSEFIFPLIGCTPEDTQGFAVSVSAMSVQAYGIVAIKPVEGQEEVVLSGLQNFIDAQVQSFTNYLADQLEVAENARLETLEDGTILMVMCADQDNIFDSISAKLS